MNLEKNKQDYEKYLEREIELYQREVSIMKEIFLNCDKLSKEDLKVLVKLLEKL